MLTAPPSLALPVWPPPPSPPSSWPPPSLPPPLHPQEEEGRGGSIEGDDRGRGGGAWEEEEETVSVPLPSHLQPRDDERGERRGEGGGRGPGGKAYPLPTRPPTPPVLVVTSSDLTYRGEGADHVVLGLRKMGQVLRLRKTSIGACPSREELVSRAARDQEVLSKVGRALLGRLLTDAADLVLVSPRPDSALSDCLLPWRKDNRQDKEINTHGVALICPDATTIFIPRHDTTNHLPTTPGTGVHYTSLVPTMPGVEAGAAGTGVPHYIPQDTPTVPALFTTMIGTGVAAGVNHMTPAASTIPRTGVVEAGVGHCIPQDTPSIPTLPSTTPGTGLAGAGVEASTVCIEIKPKQGFLDSSTPGLPLCRYCVKQFLKGGKESGSRSSYCPLDLFSGNLDRMRRAVDNLIACPQNNLKVFLDGQPIEDIRPFYYLRDTIIAALTFDLTTGEPTMTSGKLSEGSALGRILAFQNLDCIGVFHASKLYMTLIDLLGSPEAVDLALSDLSDLDLTPGKQEEEEEEVVVMMKKLQSYLLSTTAKDLSLMILLSGPYYSPAPHTPSGSSPFIVRAETGELGACIAGTGAMDGTAAGRGDVAWTGEVITGGTDAGKGTFGGDSGRGSPGKSGPEIGVAETGTLGKGELCRGFGMNTPRKVSPGKGVGGGVSRAGAWFRCQVTGVDIVAKPTSKILKHQRDHEKLRDVLEQLRTRGEEPPCCRN